MTRIGKILGLAGALALVAPSAAYADGFNSWQVCSVANVGSYVTCAAVQVSVVGSDVTLRVWNLGGDVANGGGAGNPGGIITGIGFYNVPASIDAVTNSLTQTGPVRAGNTPGKWKLTNNGRVDFIVDVAANAGLNGNNGIASGCATPAQLPGTPPQLYMNPCGGNLSNLANYVTFSFKISGGTWDPSTSDLSVRSSDFVLNETSECRTGNYPPNPTVAPNCFTVTPEPVSMTLLATGLAGMGGMGLFRRKKKSETV
jgi:hypothetical protein